MEHFDKAMESNKAQWLTKLYPENWSAKLAQTPCAKSLRIRASPWIVRRVRKSPMLMVQYRGNHSQNFANRLQNLTNIQIVFTTRKLESCLPLLKSAFFDDLKSRVFYKLSCNGCTSTYVGQTVRHLTTRIEELLLL